MRVDPVLLVRALVQRAVLQHQAERAAVQLQLPVSQKLARPRPPAHFERAADVVERKVVQAGDLAPDVHHAGSRQDDGAVVEDGRSLRGHGVGDRVAIFELKVREPDVAVVVRGVHD